MATIDNPKVSILRNILAVGGVPVSCEWMAYGYAAVRAAELLDDGYLECIDTPDGERLYVTATGCRIVQRADADAAEQEVK